MVFSYQEKPQSLNFIGYLSQTQDFIVPQTNNECQKKRENFMVQIRRYKKEEKLTQMRDKTSSSQQHPSIFGKRGLYIQSTQANPQSSISNSGKSILGSIQIIDQNIKHDMLTQLGKLFAMFEFQNRNDFEVDLLNQMTYIIDLLDVRNDCEVVNVILRYQFIFTRLLKITQSQKTFYANQMYSQKEILTQFLRLIFHLSLNLSKLEKENSIFIILETLGKFDFNHISQDSFYTLLRFIDNLTQDNTSITCLVNNLLMDSVIQLIIREITKKQEEKIMKYCFKVIGNLVSVDQEQSHEDMIRTGLIESVESLDQIKYSNPKIKCEICWIIFNLITSKSMLAREYISQSDQIVHILYNYLDYHHSQDVQLIRQSLICLISILNYKPAKMVDWLNNQESYLQQFLQLLNSLKQIKEQEVIILQIDLIWNILEFECKMNSKDFIRSFQKKGGFQIIEEMRNDSNDNLQKQCQDFLAKFDQSENHTQNQVNLFEILRQSAFQ
ncbi:UNKNOWN [Stylonychia lemnae]|uniref:Armadillo-type fold n=1 Tax=Stylonychia lemnae TaxID=5949 RepID=A0A078A3R2_STYLE|nr:UNKNOWN [Stylonychia lemnae]|eukprot:CDW75389.1 UNKNOWN [Stylonychia lemnae]